MSLRCLPAARFAALFTLGVIALAARPAADPAVAAGLRAEGTLAACSVPYADVVRGKDVEFDQCYDLNFMHDGTNYEIHTYYTEDEDYADNQDQCDYEGEDAEEAGRCEHALDDNDDGNGDNIHAVSMAEETRDALIFYFDLGIPVIGDGLTEFILMVGEDPLGGGPAWPNKFYTDDELIDGGATVSTSNRLWKRTLAEHELNHLTKQAYDADGNADPSGWFNEGVARAIEDRIDSDLDASTGHLIISDAKNVLANAESRGFPLSSDILDVSYGAFMWWTWMLDQYRDPGDVEPTLGWEALKDWYAEIEEEDDSSLDATREFIASRGGSFELDFIDYTQALYAYQFDPANERLNFLDSEIHSETAGPTAHTVHDGVDDYFPNNLYWTNPRSAQFWEFTNIPASCEFVSFAYDGLGKTHVFSVMTVDDGAIQQRWTHWGTEFARTVWAAPLERVAGVLTGLHDSAGFAGLNYGCVDASLDVLDPTPASVKAVGTADNPRQFIVRTRVTDPQGEPISGLAKSAFTVGLREPDELHSPYPATLVSAAYVDGQYWLLVQAPAAAAGVVTGNLYDLVVAIGDVEHTEAQALLYEERVVDKMIVLDRSGSMGEGSGKIEAAKNAATLMVGELAADDQGGFVRFNADATLAGQLLPMSQGNHRADLETAIAASAAVGATSIGDGMHTAQVEEDSDGAANHACSFVLLSDGYENEPAFWADVAEAVEDNGCGIETIGLGPGANEQLLHDIAMPQPEPFDPFSTLGGYDYAPETGSREIQTPVGNRTLSWQNYLARLYDAKTTRAAGRQRVMSAVGSGATIESHLFQVDPSADELVIGIGWQTPSVGSNIFILLDPNSNAVSPALYLRQSPQGTSAVWRVPDPIQGTWMLQAYVPSQQHTISASLRTLLELYLVAGVAQENAWQGAKVPILAMFADNGAPVLDATVETVVRRPNGMTTPLTLHDDGLHADGEADDGVYGNLYPITSLGEVVLEDPNGGDEGDEPNSVGSYEVAAIGTIDVHRREAQTSFVIHQDTDADEDGNPDHWEGANGLDPEDPTDGDGDPDGDGLDNRCEFDQGTDPRDADSDDGGMSDGAELPDCRRVAFDPFDPADDTVGEIQVFTARPEATLAGPFIRLHLGQPTRGLFGSADVYRRMMDAQNQPMDDWELIAEDRTDPMIEDADVVDGKRYQYRLLPEVLPARADPPVLGKTIESSIVEAKSDPYAPEGSVVIEGGAPSTRSRHVALALAAADVIDHDGHDEGDGGSIPSARTQDLELRIRLDGASAAPTWQSFTDVLTQTLQPVAGRWPAEAFVHAEFRDPAGNVGAGFAASDSIALVDPPAGDCNYDGRVDAADVSALVIETFDGDGSDPADAAMGSFPGHPAGCNANGDIQVDAGDMSCTALIVFGGRCATPPPLARSGAGTPE
jgi:hypothetical protein